MTAEIRFDVLTIFPEMFGSVLSAGVVGRALERGLIEARIHDLRAWAADDRGTTDDYPYGGGPGMVMKPEPIVAAVEALRGDSGWAVLLTPQGARLDEAAARALAARDHLLLVSGRYEGVDERVSEMVIDQEVSIGDYVLSGGEIPAMVVIDAVARLAPGVVGHPDSVAADSHTAGLLATPQYTRPDEFRGSRVPEILLSGHHEHVRRWRRAQALRRTLDRRPDLLGEEQLAAADRELLDQFGLGPERADAL